jgi:hypothetical protein
MDYLSRIDPAEEARHREVMAGLGVYDADWVLCKVLEHSDVDAGQNRLLLAKGMVRGGPIPRLFPELEELRDDELNAERIVSVTLLDAEGWEKDLTLRYLNSNKAYRVFGPEWKLFVEGTGMRKGDLIDLYACRRGDGERCLFSFTSKGGGANERKRVWQSAADAVRDHKRRPKRRRAKREDQVGYLMDDAFTGGFQVQRDYGCGKAAKRTREDRAPQSWSKKEREAAKGLLMLKYAIFAKYYY